MMIDKRKWIEVNAEDILELIKATCSSDVVESLQYASTYQILNIRDYVREEHEINDYLINVKSKLSLISWKTYELYKTPTIDSFVANSERSIVGIQNKLRGMCDLGLNPEELFEWLYADKGGLSDIRMYLVYYKFFGVNMLNYENNPKIEFSYRECLIHMLGKDVYYSYEYPTSMQKSFIANAYLETITKLGKELLVDEVMWLHRTNKTRALLALSNGLELSLYINMGLSDSELNSVIDAYLTDYDEPPVPMLWFYYRKILDKNRKGGD